MIYSYPVESRTVGHGSDLDTQLDYSLKDQKERNSRGRLLRKVPGAECNHHPRPPQELTPAAFAGFSVGAAPHGDMRSYKNIALAALVVALVASVANAHNSAPLSEYNFDFTNTPIKFLTSCAAATQSNFNRALGLLHLFWYVPELQVCAVHFLETSPRKNKCAEAVCCLFFVAGLVHFAYPFVRLHMFHADSSCFLFLISASKSSLTWWRLIF